MGKIADKLARRRSPGFSQIKELATAALHAAREESEDAEGGLAALVAQHLGHMSPIAFNGLCVSVTEEISEHPWGVEAIDELGTSIQCACERYFENDETKPSSSLFAIPLTVLSRCAAWELTFDADQSQRVVQALKDRFLVARDAAVTLLPRLLHPLEGEVAFDGEVSQILHALRKGETAAGLQVLANATQRNGLNEDLEATAALARTRPGDDVELATMGMLVGVVTSLDEDHFPLDALLWQTLPFAGDPNEPEEPAEDDEQSSAEVDAAVADVQVELDEAGQELALALGCENVTLLQAASGWYRGLTTANEHERLARARARLSACVATHAQGDIATLCTEQALIEQQGGIRLSLPVMVRATGAVVANISWPVFSQEDIAQAAVALYAFVLEAGLDVLETADESRESQAQPARTVTAMAGTWTLPNFKQRN